MLPRRQGARNKVGEIGIAAEVIQWAMPRRILRSAGRDRRQSWEESSVGMIVFCAVPITQTGRDAAEREAHQGSYFTMLVLGEPPSLLQFDHSSPIVFRPQLSFHHFREDAIVGTQTAKQPEFRKPKTTMICLEESLSF
jgi:hypothetical protein